MNKQQLIDEVAHDLGKSKADVEETLNCIIDTIVAVVSSNRDVKLVGFGTFTAILRKARRGRNPATGEEIQLEQHFAPKFKPGKDFRFVVRT